MEIIVQGRLKREKRFYCINCRTVFAAKEYEEKAKLGSRVRACRCPTRDKEVITGSRRT